jgi:hypothetical protein
VLDESGALPPSYRTVTGRLPVFAKAAWRRLAAACAAHAGLGPASLVSYDVAGLYAWRLHSGEALGTLVSSKINQ